MNPVTPLQKYVRLYIKTDIMYPLDNKGLVGLSIMGFGGVTG